MLLLEFVRKIDQVIIDSINYNLFINLKIYFLNSKNALNVNF